MGARARLEGAAGGWPPARALVPPRPTLPAGLVTLLVALFVLLGVAPLDRETWALENSLFVAALAFLLSTRRWLPLSHASWMLVFLFLVLHEVGAHYTYSRVPYARWWEALSGATPATDTARNHYDRFVHLCFGLLLAYPLRELLLRAVDARGPASYVLPVQLVLSCSALYELVEWGAAATFGGDTGSLYVGTQGDEWDSQKDMLLAASGALAAMLCVAAAHRARGADGQRLGLARRLARAG